MAPVSRMPPCSTSARRRETVDFPDPAGPSMAMVTPPAERACCVLVCIWPGYGPSTLGDGQAPHIQGTGEQLHTRGLDVGVSPAPAHVLHVHRIQNFV